MKTCAKKGRNFNWQDLTTFMCANEGGNISRKCDKEFTTFSGLAKVAISTTNIDAENQTLINHKCVCRALNRHFCQTRVSSWHSCLSACFMVVKSQHRL